MSLLFTGPRARVQRVVRAVTRGASPLAGRTVLITGASSGIGEATARAAARKGAHVLLVARREAELDRVRDLIVADGGQATTYPCDLSDLAAIDALAEQVLAEHGTVDYLVNNAGRSIRRSLHLSYDRFHDFERTMQVNYFGPVRLTMALLPSMRAQKFGHVVNIVSWGNQIKAPKFAAYVASKSALDAFARIAGRETWNDNVTFTNVRVSLVKTPMIGPTEVYRGHGEEPEVTGARIVRALEDRPITVNNALGSFFEVMNLATPRFADFLVHTINQRLPDSAAAQGNQAQGSQTQSPKSQSTVVQGIDEAS